jgi:hypothetical protein
VQDPEPEIAYYRSVEDLFASLRGVPHVLSPRDFQLLRTWWREGVPFVAVTAGLEEVFAHHRERGETDPVVSLSYCRHAVRRHAKRLADMRVGAGDDGPPSGPPEGLDRLVERVRSVAAGLGSERPAVAEVLLRVAERLELARTEVPPELLDEHLWAVETAMLRDCWRALDGADRQAIDRRVETAAADSAASDEARRRSARALRDRELRLLLDLPRLELGG